MANNRVVERCAARTARNASDRGWYGTLKNASSENHDGTLSMSLCLAQNPLAQRRADRSERSSAVAASRVGGATLML